MFLLNMNKENDSSSNLNYDTLFSIQNFPKNAALKWLQEWSENVISTGTSIELKHLDNGVRMIFIGVTKTNNCYIDILINEEKDENMTNSHLSSLTKFSTSIIIDSNETNQEIQNLIHSSTGILLESLSEDITFLINSPQEMKQYLDMQKDLEIQNEVKTITTTRTTKVETETEAVDSVKKTLYKIEESGIHSDEYIVNFIQSFSQDFCGAGIGINLDFTDNGCELKFPPTGSTTLRLQVVPVATSSHDDNDDRGMTWSIQSEILRVPRDVDSNSSSNSNSSIEEEEEIRLIDSAVKNIESRLCDTLNTVDFSFLSTKTDDNIFTTAPASDFEYDDVEVTDIDSSFLKDTKPSSTSPPFPASPMRQKQKSPQETRRRDPKVVEKAKEFNLNLENFEGKGLEEQAVQQLNDMMNNKKRDGFLSIIKPLNDNKDTSKSSSSTVTVTAGNGDSMNVTPNSKEEREKLFQDGVELSKQTWMEMLERDYEKYPESVADLLKPPTKLPVNLEAAGYEEGVDILAGPPVPPEGRTIPASSLVGQQLAAGNLTAADLGTTDSDSSIEVPKTGDSEALLRPKNMKRWEQDRVSLQLLVGELSRYAGEDNLQKQILTAYKDLLLSDNLLYLLREESNSNLDHTDRLILQQISEAAAAVTLELGALAKTESVRHLETIHDICETAFALQHDEDSFLNRLDVLKTQFDTELLGYLQFAIEEEKRSLIAAGGDPTTMPSRWLQVLQIIHQGVIAEFEARYDRLLEPLLLHLRFDQPIIRSNLFQRFVNMTPPLDLRYMRELAINMANNILNNPSLNSNTNPELLELEPKMKQLLIDVECHLSEEIVEEKTEEFIKDAESRGTKVMFHHRNPVIQAQIEDDAIQLRDAELARLRQNVGRSVLDSKAKSDSNTNSDGMNKQTNQ